MFCRQAVAAVRRVANADPAYPKVLLFCLSDPGEAEAFFERHWPSARVVCDPDKTIYQTFGLARGSLGQFFGPGVMVAGVRALFRGFGVGAPRGDVRQMSGAFVVANDRITWRHVYRHAGDHPDFAALAVETATA